MPPSPRLEPRWAFFPVTACLDETLTCIACGGTQCELGVEVLGNGRHIWCGLHKACLLRHEERARKEIPTRYERLSDEDLADELAAWADD